MGGLAARSRRRAIGSRAAALAAALGLAGCGGAAHDLQRPAPQSYAYFTLRSPHVLSGYTNYSLSSAPSAPRFAPTRESALAEPIAEYRSYALAQLGLMQSELGALRTALADGAREAAKAAWRNVYSRYLRLGAVYLAGEVSSLDKQIDGTSGGLEGGPSNPGFTGLHRIEYGLWTGAAPDSLLGYESRLVAAVRRLEQVLPRVKITPLEYVTRAHEILEDALRDQLSGADVPWSGEGVLGTAAGLAATEEVLSTLHALLGGEEPVAPAIEAELDALRKAFARIAGAHGGRLPSNAGMSQSQAELLEGTLGGALEALSEVPEVLETEAPPRYEPIPAHDVRIDP